MKILHAPARYQKFLNDRIEAALKEIENDIALRADEEPRVRALASVPDRMIDQRRTGNLMIVVGDMEKAS